MVFYLKKSTPLNCNQEVLYDPIIAIGFSLQRTEIYRVIENCTLTILILTSEMKEI